jgi:hypothetical protein
MDFAPTLVPLASSEGFLCSQIWILTSWVDFERFVEYANDASVASNISFLKMFESSRQWTIYTPQEKWTIQFIYETQTKKSSQLNEPYDDTFVPTLKH